MDKEAASEFKTYLLYIVPSDGNSQKALELVQQSHELQPDVWVQDVRLLKPPLPPWLNGVPTVVRRSSGEVYKGTACLQFLQDCVNKTPKCLQGIGAGNLQAFDSGESVDTRFEMAGPSSTSTMDRTGKLTEDQVSAYTAARKAQDQYYSGDKPQDLISTQS
jgi:hypothetical protein